VAQRGSRDRAGNVAGCDCSSGAVLTGTLLQYQRQPFGHHGCITLTEGMRQVAPPGSEQRFGLTVPMGRAGHVNEMAGAAVFLASDLSGYITGQTIHVDGGTQASSGWYHHPETGAYALGPTGI
jgi:NAD(P)-dependent dehydrogenase (short-subunit alcohol dehydrogenase family)